MTIGLHRYKPIFAKETLTFARIASLQNRAVPLPDKEIRSSFPYRRTLSSPALASGDGVWSLGILDILKLSFGSSIEFVLQF